MSFIFVLSGKRASFRGSFSPAPLRLVLGVVPRWETEAQARDAHERPLQSHHGKPYRILHVRLGLDAGKVGGDQGEPVVRMLWLVLPVVLDAAAADDADVQAVVVWKYECGGTFSSSYDRVRLLPMMTCPSYLRRCR